MRPIQRILVPVDFSEHSAEALRYAAFLAEQLGAKIEVLHVWQPVPYVAQGSLVMVGGELQSFWNHLEEQLTSQLTAFVADICGADNDVPKRVEAGYVSQDIVRATEADAYDLVVMGTAGRTGIKHLILGSVAARVVRLAACPVLTVSTQKAQQAVA